MIAVDTNVLVYSHRTDSPLHEDAKNLIEDLRKGKAQWAVPWPCLHEFVAIVTHPRIFKEPTPLRLAFEAIDSWLAGENLHLIGESEGYLEKLREQAIKARLQGAMIHDARIAALCLHHGIDELLSADRDFKLFSDLSTRNPLVSVAR